MARVKNTLRRELGEAVGLPRAKFPVTRTVQTVATCSECGKAVRRSNLARHVRNRHARGRGVQSGVGSPATSFQLSESPREGLKLKIRLPAVDRRLKDLRASSSEDEEELTRCLPPTPGDEDELYRELAKLYAARVPRSVPSALTYEQTKTLLAVAREEELRKDLKEVMLSAGLVLRSQQEWQQELEAAEARGRDQMNQQPTRMTSPPPVLDRVPSEGTASPASQPAVEEVGLVSAPSSASSTAVLNVPPPPAPVVPPVPSTQQPVSVPPLFISSHFEEGQPQVITLHSGGSWGIKIVPCQMTST